MMNMRILAYLKVLIKNGVYVFMGLTIIASLFIISLDNQRKTSYEDQIVERSVKSPAEEEVKIAFVICCKTEEENVLGGGAEDKSAFASDVTRQITQALVMIKSAVALSSSPIRIYAVLDTDSLFDALLEGMKTWPEKFLNRLILEKRNMFYPKGTEHFRALFRICSTARIFIPEILSDLDSVIYMDTDFIFMRPPQELWDHFKNYDSKQLMGMSPCLNHYNTPRNKVPYYGQTGVNAGYILMNITRMREFPWISKCIEKEEKHRPNIKIGDQDIINAVFNEFPDYLYEVDCTWNYRMWICSHKTNLCPEAITKGVSLLHGNALAFVADRDLKIQTFYEVWRDYSPSDSLKDFLATLRTELKSIKPGRKSKCAKLSKIDRILTFGLERHLQ